MANLPDPVTRKEQYLSVMAENTAQYPEEPITREEMYLDYLCKNGTGGGSITPEQIQAAVDQYLEENPVSAGELSVSNHIISLVGGNNNENP